MAISPLLSSGVPGLKSYNVTVDPALLAAGAAANTDVAVSGLSATDRVVGYSAPDALEAGLVPQSVSVPAAETLRFRLYNPSAAGVDGAARTWIVTVMEL